jgi:type VI secretion system protein ImpL
MFKKTGVFLLWVLLLASFALVLWGLALYEDWPLWYVPVLFIGTILLALACADEKRVATESS